MHAPEKYIDACNHVGKNQKLYPEQNSQTQKGTNVWVHSFEISQKVEPIYNGKAHQWLPRLGGGRDDKDWLQRNAERTLRDDGNILELACGSGYTCIHICKKFLNST